MEGFLFFHALEVVLPQLQIAQICSRVRWCPLFTLA